MRRVSMLVAIVLLGGLCFISSGQSSPAFSAVEEGRAEVRPILDLAHRSGSGSFKPKISMQDALKLAEGYIEKQHIDISSYWLFRGIFYLSGDEHTADKDKLPGWHFWWVHESGAMGDYVEIFVGMDGRATRLTSM